MRNLILLICALSIGLLSCKKDDPAEPAPTPTPVPASPNYYPMKVGNYWIYDTYLVDTNNVETYQGRDSIYVKADTVINGNTYHIIDRTGNGPMHFSTSFLRDSADCVVNSTGHIYFSPHLADTTSISNYPGAGTVYYIVDQGGSVTVPAGTFSTFDMKGHFYSQDPNYPYGIPRYSHEHYSAGTGMVKMMLFYVMSPSTLETRLVRYHI